MIPIGPGRVHQRRAGEVLHPARDSFATLERIRREMGSHAFSAQYQQDPLPLDGELLRWSWFRSYRRAPRAAGGRSGHPKLGHRLQRPRRSTTGRPAPPGSGAGQEHYLLDVWRGRLDYPSLGARW